MRVTKIPDHVEHGNEYRHLNNEGKATTKGINLAVLVELHNLFLLLLAILLVLGPDLVHLGLQVLHGAHALDLSDGQGKQQRAYDHRKDGNAEPPRRTMRVEELQTAGQKVGKRRKYFF